MLAFTSEDAFLSFHSTFQHAGIIQQTPLFTGSFSGLCLALSTSVFSLFLNANIPIVLDALSNKSNLVVVLTRGFAICTLLYIWLGISVSMRFQSAVDNPCNLNWDGYRWPSYMFQSCVDGSVCDVSAKMVEFLIVFCPVLDVISIYPLGSIVLGNSIWEVIVRCMHSSHQYQPYQPVPSDASSSADTPPPAHPASILLTQMGKKQTMSYNSTSAEGDQEDNTSASSPSPPQSTCSALPARLLRLVVNILPMVLAVVKPDFCGVVQYAGSISVVICLVFPAYMSLKCDDYEAKYTVAVINPKDHLHWCDEPQSQTNTTDARNLSPFMGGLGIRRRDSFWSNETSWTETRVTKKATLAFGGVVTCVILFASVYYG
jgi:hypothetical protein